MHGGTNGNGAMRGATNGAGAMMANGIVESSASMSSGMLQSGLDRKYVNAATGGTRGSTNKAYWCKLEGILDKMMLHKDETLKDPNETLTFMRRAATIRKELRDTSRDNATEHVELDKDEVSLCYLR